MFRRVCEEDAAASVAVVVVAVAVVAAVLFVAIFTLVPFVNLIVSM